MGGHCFWKDSGTLADGREIIYFDESPSLHRAAVPDRRHLARLPAAASPEAGERFPPAGLRWDALAGEWVIIAAQRQDRTFLPPTEECPLDPSRDGKLTEIPADDYDVVVFENRFPSLRGIPAVPEPAPAPASPAGPSAGGAAQGGAAQGGAAQAGAAQAGAAQAGAADGPPETGGVPGRPAIGRCEVVCFTSDHNSSFAKLSPYRVRTVLEAWVDRTTALESIPGIVQVYPFENRGEEIGVTLTHPHGQIYGYPFVTPRTAHTLSQARAYAAAGRGNLFDDLAAGEVAARTRIVSANDHWTAFVPAAARWPYEVLLFPAERVPSLPDLGDAARGAFGDIYLEVLSRFDALFGMPLPYIAAWHQAPANGEFARQEYAAHLQLFTIRRAPGKLKYLAGSESGMGTWINDVLPEDAARRLREAM